MADEMCEDASGFPIPMRGNELTWVRDLEPVETFPIPMRGNESAATTASAPRYLMFSDPHEG